MCGWFAGGRVGNVPIVELYARGDVEATQFHLALVLEFNLALSSALLDFAGATRMKTASFLRELDQSISKGSASGCMRALWHATDVLIAGQYSEEEIWVFGEVIERLARELEVEARAKLATRLAGSRNAPINCINELAVDQSIDVAGPILSQSERIDVPTLISIASSASQHHLLAITKRKSVTEPVTDVLVTKGDRDVIKSLIANLGARFSKFGFLQLVKRSEHDSILVETLGLRQDIPRAVFQQLIAKASDDVRMKLERERPEMGAEIGALVTNVAGELQSIFGPASKDYHCAKKAVSALHRYGNLTEKNVFEYAQSHKIQEVIVSLSLMCSLPANVIERGLLDQTGEMPLVFAKALNFSWETTMSLLFMSAPNFKILVHDLDELNAKFSRLSVDTAQGLIRLYQSRKGLN